MPNDPVPTVPPSHVYTFDRSDMLLVKGILPALMGARENPQAVWESVYLGLCGELAFCRMTGTPDSLIRRSYGQSPHSFTFSDSPTEAVTISVCTSARYNNLAAEIRPRGEYSTRYIAARYRTELDGVITRVYMLGHQTGEFVATQPQRPGIDGANPFHVVKRGALLPFAEGFFVWAGNARRGRLF